MGTAPSTDPRVGGSRGSGCTQTCPAADDAPSTIRKQIQALPPVPSHVVRGLGSGPSESASPPPSKSIYPLGLGGLETGCHPSFSHSLEHLTSKSQRLHLQQTQNLPTSLAAWSHHLLVPLTVSLLPPSRPTTRPRPAFILPGARARRSVFPVCALVDLSPRAVSPQEQSPLFPPYAGTPVPERHQRAGMRREARPERAVLMQNGRVLTQGPRRACWRRWGSVTWAWSPTLSGSYGQGLSGRRLSSAIQDAALKEPCAQAHRSREHWMRPCHAALGLGSYRHPCTEVSAQQVLTGPCCIGVRLEGPGGGTTEPTSAREHIRGTQTGHLGCRDVVKVGLGKRSCWEDNEGNSVGGRGNSPCKGSEQKAPAAPLSSEGCAGMVGVDRSSSQRAGVCAGPFQADFLQHSCWHPSCGHQQPGKRAAETLLHCLGLGLCFLFKEKQLGGQESMDIWRDS